MSAHQVGLFFFLQPVVGSLLALEYGLLEPLKRALERWREAGG